MELDGDRTDSPPTHPPELTPAAVLIPLVRSRSDRTIVFTRRAPDLDAHPGQMSFPGGRFEPADSDLLQTGLRETEEELGVATDDIDVIGRIDPIETVTGFFVLPYVATVPPGPYEPDPDEVDEVVTIPVSAFTDERHYELEHLDHPDSDRTRVHYFHVDGYTVWGATAAILVDYLELTEGWRPPDR